MMIWQNRASLKRISILVVLIFGLTALVACSGERVEPDPNESDIGAELPPSDVGNDRADDAADDASDDADDEAGDRTGDDTGNEAEDGAFPDLPDPVVDPIQLQVEAMTLDEKIGQMVLAGVDEQQVTEASRELMMSYHIGGFILFARNMDDVEQTASYINELKRVNDEEGGIPLFINVDQEGGRVNRLPGLRQLPSALQIGATEQTALSYAVGQLLGEQLHAFGFNMNNAPVLDIFSNPSNRVIGDRAYGTSAEVVQMHGPQVMAGMQSVDIIPVVKHFPGHGDTEVDSHVDIPVVHKSSDELMAFEWLPFIDAIEQGADVVMSSHIVMTELDPQYPASLSYTMMTTVLRDMLQFDGVIMTDDMTMGAITKHYDIGEAAVIAVNAGNDIVMVAHDVQSVMAVLAALKQAVEVGTIEESVIDESVYRILQLKESYRLTNAPTELDEEALSHLNEKVDAMVNTIETMLGE